MCVYVKQIKVLIRTQVNGQKSKMKLWISITIKQLKLGTISHLNSKPEFKCSLKALWKLYQNLMLTLYPKGTIYLTVFALNSLETLKKILRYTSVQHVSELTM